MIGESISGGLSVYLAGIVIFLIIYYGFLKKKRLSTYRKIIFILFFVYLVLVVEKTMMPIPVNYTQIEMWREGFASFKTSGFYNFIPSFDLTSDLWRRNIVLNVIMFMPFGFLWPLYKGKFNLKYILISSTVFTLIIELYQLCMALTMHAPLWFFDVNDIIANVLGGFIGYLILTFISPYIFKRISKKAIYEGKS